MLHNCLTRFFLPGGLTPPPLMDLPSTFLYTATGAEDLLLQIAIQSANAHTHKLRKRDANTSQILCNLMFFFSKSRQISHLGLWHEAEEEGDLYRGADLLLASAIRKFFFTLSILLENMQDTSRDLTQVCVYTIPLKHLAPIVCHLGKAAKRVTNIFASEMPSDNWHCFFPHTADYILTLVIGHTRTI